MTAIKEWFSMLSFGNTKRYRNITLWFLFDSIAATIPYGIAVMAIYYLLLPIGAGNIQMQTKPLWILVGILLIQFISYFFIRKKSYIDSCVGMSETMKRSRIDMGEHLRILPMGFFDKRDAGDLSTVLLRDYTTVENLAEQFAPQMTVTIGRLLLSAVMLGVFDIRMTLAMFLVIPLALPFAWMSYRRMKDSSQELSQAQQSVSSNILEYVEGIQTLKAYNMAGEHFIALKESFEKQRTSSIAIETRAASPISVVGRIILNLGIALVMLLGGILMTKGSLHPFYYIAFMVMTLSVYEPVSTLFVFIADFSRSKRSGDRIREIFDERPLPEPEDTIERAVYKDAQFCPVRNADSTITLERVSFAYGDVDVIQDLTIQFPEKQVTALVGPSGSGKSTITKLIARFWDADKGRVLIGGVPVTHMKTDEVLAKVAIVFQDVYLFHDSIEANIRMGKSNATREEVIDAAKKAACHDFILSLPQGYDTMVGEGGSTLSGGEKQRISIARALLKDAPIVLLDEATAALDSENEVLIQRAISSLVEKKTVVVVAHRLQSICNADQIVVLDQGRIIEHGSHKELLEAAGMYAHLWEEQSHAGNWRI
ncbi:MAG: ABC transporter ATP-binding protein [Lachnospiraceae bacterium]|nr:ABC transporter ATP-binding protein [Lachnospiraceae bacterium]